MLPLLKVKEFVTCKTPGEAPGATVPPLPTVRWSSVPLPPQGACFHDCLSRDPFDEKRSIAKFADAVVGRLGHEIRFYHCGHTCIDRHIPRKHLQLIVLERGKGPRTRLLQRFGLIGD